MVRRGILLESLVLLPHVGEEVFAQFFGVLHFFRIGAAATDQYRDKKRQTWKWHLRYVQIHGFITLTVGAGLPESRAATLDLHAASSLVLDVLDIGTALANNLRAQIETRNRLKVDGNALFWPFPLNAT